MMRLARTALAAAALTALAGSGAPQPTSNLTFYQLDIDFDGDKRHKSQWGYAELDYVGSAETLYFNLAVEGFWRLRNIPVLSPDGPGEPYVASLGFDLGVQPGTKVKFISYAAALTGSVLSEMPQSLQVARVHGKHYRLYTGFGGDPIQFSPPAPFQQGAAQGGPKYEHKGFPNQQAGKDECVPAAVSNSLMWLNQKYNLQIPDAHLTIAHAKVATDWDKRRPGCDDNWPQKKKEHLEADGTPITTETISRLEFQKVEEAVKNGCDVEIGIDNHTAAVTAIQKLAPGSDPSDPEYALTLTHDADQKSNAKETAVNEPVTYDDDGLRFHGPPWVENKPVEFIVVECPFTPTPTPTPGTPTPSHTNTPQSPTPEPSSTPTPPPSSSPTPTWTPSPSVSPSG
ncbi:MAG: hypothetical protein ABR576_10940 [Thermoanaerobaculia bacterium]